MCIRDSNDTELLKGHNVYTVLSQMSYLHGSSFAVAKERLARTGSCYSNAVLDLSLIHIFSCQK